MTSYLRHRFLLQSRVSNNCFNRVEHSIAAAFAIKCRQPTDTNCRTRTHSRRTPSHDHKRFAPICCARPFSFLLHNTNKQQQRLSVPNVFLYNSWRLEIALAKRIATLKHQGSDKRKSSGIKLPPPNKKKYPPEESQCHHRQRRTIGTLSVAS